MNARNINDLGMNNMNKKASCGGLVVWLEPSTPILEIVSSNTPVLAQVWHGVTGWSQFNYDWVTMLGKKFPARCANMAQSCSPATHCESSSILKKMNKKAIFWKTLNSFSIISQPYLALPINFLRQSFPKFRLVTELTPRVGTILERVGGSQSCTFWESVQLDCI